MLELGFTSIKLKNLRVPLKDLIWPFEILSNLAGRILSISHLANRDSTGKNEEFLKLKSLFQNYLEIQLFFKILSSKLFRSICISFEIHDRLGLDAYQWSIQNFSKKWYHDIKMTSVLNSSSLKFVWGARMAQKKIMLLYALQMKAA
jgi:hypothetical protein